MQQRFVPKHKFFIGSYPSRTITLFSKLTLACQSVVLENAGVRCETEVETESFLLNHSPLFPSLLILLLFLCSFFPRARKRLLDSLN